MMFWKNRHLILSAYYSACGPVRLPRPAGEKTAPRIPLSVLPRRHFIQLPEHPVKMLHILKSHPAAYLRYADICIFQKDGSFLKSDFLYNLCK